MMKALVKSQAEVGLWLEDVPEPEVGVNDVLIRVHKTGICGTDLHIYNWDAWARKTIPVPMVVGHEFVGEIVAVGTSVKNFPIGDIVSGEGHVVCGQCRNCWPVADISVRTRVGIGVNRTGAFAEYISIPQTNVWQHAQGIDPELASIFDPFGNAVHTALSFNVLGEDVLDHRRGTDRVHGSRHVQVRGSTLCRGDRREPLATGTGPADGSHPRSRCPEGKHRRCPARTRDARRI